MQKDREYEQLKDLIPFPTAEIMTAPNTLVEQTYSNVGQDNPSSDLIARPTTAAQYTAKTSLDFEHFNVHAADMNKQYIVVQQSPKRLDGGFSRRDL